MKQKSDDDREIQSDLLKNKNQNSRKTSVRSDKTKQDPDPLHAKITGKGSLFNEVI